MDCPHCKKEMEAGTTLCSHCGNMPVETVMTQVGGGFAFLSLLCAVLTWLSLLGLFGYVLFFLLTALPMLPLALMLVFVSAGQMCTMLLLHSLPPLIGILFGFLGLKSKRSGIARKSIRFNTIGMILYLAMALPFLTMALLAMLFAEIFSTQQ